MAETESAEEKMARYLARGTKDLKLSEKEKEQFKKEVDEELPDWTRDDTGKVVLTAYYTEAVQMVRERWLEKKGKA